MKILNSVSVGEFLRMQLFKNGWFSSLGLVKSVIKQTSHQESIKTVQCRDEMFTPLHRAGLVTECSLIEGYITPVGGLYTAFSVSPNIQRHTVGWAAKNLFEKKRSWPNRGTILASVRKE
jgi:hypothetical protein